MNNDYVPLGWEAAPTNYNTAADYNPHGLNDDKADHMVKSAAMFAKLDSEQELDFGEAHIYDYRLRDNEVVYGD
jgi:hypothetical protein